MAKNYPWSPGDKPLASELNDVGGLDTQTAGETINGVTTPAPVYLYDTDDELYECDSDDSSKLAFIGFAISNGTDGNSIDFQAEGIVGGFTGLTKGALYYVQSGGGIGTTRGVHSVLVGIAISTTEILIEKDISSIQGTYEVEASDILQNSADTERTHTGDTNFILQKSITVRHSGIVRITYEIKNSGTAITTTELRDERGNVLATASNNTSVYITKSHNVVVVAGTQLKLYVSCSTTGNITYVKNYRVKYNEVAGTVSEVLID